MRRTVNVLRNALLIFLSAVNVLPLLWMGYSSLKSEARFNQDILGLPRQIRWDNYVKAIRFGRLDGYFLNSVIVTAATVAIVVAACFVVAYFLARYAFRGRNLIFLLFVAGLLIPIHALLVPIFLQFRTIGLLDSRLGLIVVYAAINMPVGVFLFESYIRTIPRELDEAAHIDGATTAWTLRRVIFPLSTPIAFTVALLTILRSWNEFPLALVLIRSDALRTLPIGLANFQGTFFTEFTPLFAALVIVTAPVLLLYIFFNRHISKGMVAGAVKG